MQVLNQYQSNDLLQRLPTFELSYETVSHKKVSDQYDITLAIPYGRKVFLWFKYYQDKNVWFLLELNNYKKIRICIYLKIIKADKSFFSL